MGRRGREFALEEANRDLAVARYRSVIGELVGR